MTREELSKLGYIYGGGYYIHLHQKNIGRLKSPGYSDSQVSISTIAKDFADQKKNAQQAIQTQYKELFLANVVSQKDYSAINALLNKDNDNLDKINEALKKYFQEGLNSNIIQKLIQKQQNIVWDETEMTKALQEGGESMKSFDSLLDNLAKAVKILDKNGKDIALILINAKNTQTTVEMGEYLYTALKEAERKIFGTETDPKTKKEVVKEAVTINKTRLQNAIDALIKISAKLRTGDKSGKIVESKDKKNPITAQFLKDSINRNFFSTVLGESVAAGINNRAVTTSTVYVKNTLKNIQSTGKDTVHFISSGPSGSYADGVKDDGAPKQGKADVKFNNVELHLEQLFPNESYGTVKLNIGLSNKAYKNLSLNAEKPTDSLVMGGSIKFNKILSMLTFNDRLKYLTYNVLAWSSDSAPKELKEGAESITPALEAIQDVLFTRATLHIFAARGKTDFANFMFVNGQLISMLDVVKAVINAKNLTTISTMDVTSSKAVYSIKGRSKWWNSISKDLVDDDLLRTQTLHNAIFDSSIEGHINPFTFKK